MATPPVVLSYRTLCLLASFCTVVAMPLLTDHPTGSIPRPVLIYKKLI